MYGECILYIIFHSHGFFFLRHEEQLVILLNVLIHHPQPRFCVLSTVYLLLKIRQLMITISPQLMNEFHFGRTFIIHYELSPIQIYNVKQSNKNTVSNTSYLKMSTVLLYTITL